VQISRQVLTAALLLASLTSAQAQSPCSPARDPFQALTGEAPHPRVHHQLQLPQQRDPFLAARAYHVRVEVHPMRPEGKKLASRAPVQQPEPVAPKVAVHGIVESPQGNYAILTGTQRSFIVRLGDTLGDTQVTRIGRGSVDVTRHAHTYTLPLAK
jgi:Tfp pilus assembly protein PilP